MVFSPALNKANKEGETPDTLNCVLLSHAHLPEGLGSRLWFTSKLQSTCRKIHMLVTADGRKPSSAVPATERINWKMRWFRKGVFFHRRKAKIWKGDMHSGIPSCVSSPLSTSTASFYSAPYPRSLRPHPFSQTTPLLSDHTPCSQTTPLTLWSCHPSWVFSENTSSFRVPLLSMPVLLGLRDGMSHRTYHLMSLCFPHL